MDRLTIGCCGGYAPRELCDIDETGRAKGCVPCPKYCKEWEAESKNCWGCAINRCFNRLGEYENTGLTPEQIGEMDSLYKAKCRELAEYKARQQGSAPDLSGRIGQEVYIVGLDRSGYTTGEVVSIKISAHGASLRIYVPSDRQHINRAAEQIGRSVFFDRAAAEKALGRRAGTR